ncbi:MAG: hypothetical protein ACTHMX_15535, partial [Thermomicrobiales bacterium]
MVWKRLFRQNDPDNDKDHASTPVEEMAEAPVNQADPPPIPGARMPGCGSAASGSHTPAGTPSLPPHMQRVVQERRRPAGSPASDPRQRLARLQQQRLAILFDVDQGELAEDDENPWTHRIALLTEAMETVNADLATLAAAPPAPTWPVPPTPITDLAASDGQPFTLALRIGGEA